MGPRIIGFHCRASFIGFPPHAGIQIARVNAKLRADDNVKAGIVLANEFGRVVRPIVAGQLHRTGLQIQPHARFYEFLARPVVVRIERQLQQFGVGLYQAGVLEFAQLPGMAEPSPNIGLRLRLEFRGFQPVVQVLAALFAQRMQPVELVERRAVDPLPFGHLQFVLRVDLRAIEQTGQSVKRILCARQVGVAKLLGLLLDLPRRFGVERPQPGAHQVIHQGLQKIKAAQLRLDLFLERAGVDLVGLVRLLFFLLSTLLYLRALFGNICRHILLHKLRSLRVRVEQRK